MIIIESKCRFLLILNLLTLFLITQSCDKEEVKPDIYFPVGRLSVLNDGITVYKNNQEANYELVYDNFGAYLVKIEASQYVESDELKIKFTRTDEPTEKFIDSTNKENWLNPSYLVNSDNDTIKSKALELTAGLNTKIEKATAIHQYIVENLEFDLSVYHASGILASKTLNDGIIGICMNFSRLFVALCRAVEIPARTVWGVVYGSTDDGVYNYHHQWAEFCNDDGSWLACDFTYRTDFFNNDMRYTDLFYGAEEYFTIAENTEWLPWFNNMGLTSKNYPIVSGDLGFKLVSDNRPDSMVVEYSIKF